MRKQSPFLNAWEPASFGSKCGSAGWSLMPTMGDSLAQVSPSSSNRFRMNRASSYSVSVRPLASALPISAKASFLMRCIASPARRGL
jgi:hypothetical protein